MCKKLQFESFTFTAVLIIMPVAEHLIIKKMNPTIYPMTINMFLLIFFLLSYFINLNKVYSFNKALLCSKRKYLKSKAT